MIRFSSERNRKGSISGGMRRFSRVIDELNLKIFLFKGVALLGEEG